MRVCLLSSRAAFVEYKDRFHRRNTDTITGGRLSHAGADIPLIHPTVGASPYNCSFPPDGIQKRRMLPTFIGIGAPKCATTWLHNCLDAHPDVFMADVKETNFFVFDTIEGRLEEYTAHYEDASGEEAVGELSVSYIYSKMAPRRVYRLIPDAKLFVSLRNPIDQAYSLYWHRQRQNFHRWDLKSALEVDSFKKAIKVFTDELLDPCRHHRNIQRWLQYFNQSQLHVLLLDDIKEDADQEVAKLYEHIGVDPSFRPNSMQDTGRSARRGTSPRGPLIERTRQVLYHVLTRYAYHPLKRAIGQYTADRVKEMLRLRQMMEHFFRQDGYPEMDSDIRSRLQEEFKDEIRSLELLLDRDLSHWQ